MIGNPAELTVGNNHPLVLKIIIIGSIILALGGCAISRGEVSCIGTTCSVATMHPYAELENIADSKAKAKAEDYCSSRDQRMRIVRLTHSYDPRVGAGFLGVMMGARSVYTHLSFTCLSDGSKKIVPTSAAP